MTKQEIRAEWVKRLRSGEIEQAKNYLGLVGGSRCCLGVLCDIAAEEGIILQPRFSDTFVGKLEYSGTATVVPSSVLLWSGLKQSSGFYGDGEKALSKFNDNSTIGFAGIADIIESEPDGLFVKETA